MLLTHFVGDAHSRQAHELGEGRVWATRAAERDLLGPALIELQNGAAEAVAKGAPARGSHLRARLLIDHDERSWHNDGACGRADRLRDQGTA
jgi:hypothetical protein